MAKNAMVNNKQSSSLSEDEPLALWAVGVLNDDAQHLDASSLQALAHSRQLAVQHLADREAQVASLHTLKQAGHGLQWLAQGWQHYAERHRMWSSLMLGVAMALVFYAAQQLGVTNSIEQGDAFLLASELPPEAFADKGFDTWLGSKQD